MEKLKLDKKRFRASICPCGKSNKDGKFVPYEGHSVNGYCHSCGETFLPKFTNFDNWSTNSPTEHFQPKAIVKISKLVSHIPVDVFKASLKEHEANNFVRYLMKLFNAEVASELISRYFIGTSKHWSGSTVFWQIDATGAIRSGKVMLYNADTGKRVKEPFCHVTWVHKLINQPEFNLSQCLFGEHLLSIPENAKKRVALVESEKTAIIASIYLPQFLWLAVGSKEGLSQDKCRILAGRTVLLFPDLNGFDSWSNKANELNHIATFIVSDLLERKASEAERIQGLDLADYLTRFSLTEFQKQESNEPTSVERPLNISNCNSEMLAKVNIEDLAKFNIQPTISEYELQKIKRVFHWMDCIELSERELLNGIVYEMERGLTIDQRLKPHSAEDNAKARDLILKATEAGKLICNPPLYVLAETITNNNTKKRTNEDKK